MRLRSPVVFAALALLAVTGGACKRAADLQPISTRPQTDGAAPTSARAVRKQARSGAGQRPSARASTVAVATADNVEVAPCERMCGSLGDCLVSEGRRGAEASHLELACLDLCLNVDPQSAAGQDFRGCEARADSCPGMVACARSHWLAAGEARLRGPATAATVAAVADPCRQTCEGLYSCMYFDTPRSVDLDGTGDPQYMQSVQDCIAGCDPMDRYIQEFAACTDVSVCMDQWECSARIHDY